MTVGCTFPVVRAEEGGPPRAVGGAKWVDGVCGQQPICFILGPPPEPTSSELDVIKLEGSDVGEPIVCDASEPVRLGQGEFALVPCRGIEVCCLSGREGRGHVVANGAACVRAVEGPWNRPRQLALIGNLDWPTVEIANGDFVGAVLREAEDGPCEHDRPEIAHVWQY
ncbi:hypothetical protein N9L68_08475 [bacterium]|nr:hypothetical protein [bacterium]